VRLVVADVPPVVHDSRSDLDLFPRPGQFIATIDMEANGAGQHLEALGDVRVRVLAGHPSARPDVQVAHQALALGVRAPFPYNEPIALNSVLVDLASLHHPASLLEYLTI